jgi:PBP1b-binding outer membrane lipoprotein LpoB
MKKSISALLGLLLFLPLFSSCSSDQDNKEKGAIEQGTEKVAKEIVDTYKTPMDNAKKAVEVENTHGQQVEEQVQKQ